MVTLKHLIPAILLLLSCSACNLIAPKQLYDGEMRPLDQVASIQPDPGVYVTIFSLEKEKPKEVGEISDGRSFALLPGKYRAMVTYSREIKQYSHEKKQTIVTSTKYSVTPGFIEFKVMAGATYRLKIKDTGYKKWRPILFDSSGSEVSKLTTPY